MRNVKLLELVTCLNSPEQKAFEKYLSSAYFNNDDRIIQLYSILIKRVRGESEIDKKYIFKTILPGKKYDDKTIRYLFSGLSKHIENFLALKEFENDEQRYLILLKQSLSKRNANKSYSFARLQFESGKKEQSAKNYLNNYIGSELHHSYSANRLSRIHHLNYESIVTNLDQFYLLRKLQLHCELINLKNVLNAEYKMLLIEEICSLVTKNNFFESKAIEIYYHILLTLTEAEDEKHFVKLIALVEEHSELFPVENLNEMYQYVKNYCIKMINKGNDSYRNKLFGIYKSILLNTRIMNAQHLSQWEYKNIVTLGLRLKENKWVKEFIKKYINYLDPKQRKNALTYNTAMLAHYEKRYGQTLKILQALEFTDLYYQLDSRSILLKVYFETDETETMLYHISAFKVFLKRNKLISEYQRAIYKNFIKYSLKLFRAGVNKKKLFTVREEIQNQKNISDKTWLLERAEELI